VGVARDPGDAGLVEARSKWVLPVGSGIVTQLRIDAAFTLVMESWIVFRIEAAFSYGRDGAQRTFDPSDSAGLAPLLKLYRAVVTSAEIRKDGQLTLRFADGGALVVTSDEDYEAFNVTGTLPPLDRGFHFVAVPGGGLARF